METVGDIIKKYREANGLTLSGLANMIGLTPGGLSHFETGRRKPNQETLKKIANILKIPDDVYQERLSSHLIKESDEDYISIKRNPPFNRSEGDITIELSNLTLCIDVKVKPNTDDLDKETRQRTMVLQRTIENATVKAIQEFLVDNEPELLKLISNEITQIKERMLSNADFLDKIASDLIDNADK
jgi:transcriptional regulator with XRE-family HTH domain